MLQERPNFCPPPKCSKLGLSIYLYESFFPHAVLASITTVTLVPSQALPSNLASTKTTVPRNSEARASPTDTLFPETNEISRPLAHGTSQASLTGSELEAEIAKLKKDFEDLVDLIEDSFSSCVPLKKILRSIKHIPVSLSQDLGIYFREESSRILRTDSIQHLFVLMAPMWGYLNPGLLEFLVGRFGSQDDIADMQKYLEKLGTFRQRVKLGDFVRVRHTKENALNRFRFKKIITIMGRDWENQTLQDAENFRVEFAQEYYLQPFVPRMDIVPSSIAIVICLPHWLEINLDKLSGFFNRNRVKRVFMDGHVDWMMKVRGCKSFMHSVNFVLMLLV